MKPTANQINKFFKILEKKFNEQLFIDSEIYHDQLESFYNYGDFFAQVGEDNYEKVCQKLSIALTNYNLSSRESSIVFQDSWDYKKISDSLKKAKAFKSTISSKENNIQSQRDKKFLNLNILLDEYIEDLEKISNSSSTGPTNIVPPSHFGKRAKKTKTPLKNLLNEIIKEYNITNYSTKSKQLIDALY